MLPGQFIGPGMSAGVEGTHFLDILQAGSLDTNLKCCLDAGARASYGGSGQTWLDLTTNNADFYLGPDGTSSAEDPTFNGVAGGLSSDEYFSVDGGDYFRIVGSNPSWIDNLHKDNAQFTILSWIYPGSATDNCQIFGTRGEGNSNVGVDHYLSHFQIVLLHERNVGLAVGDGLGNLVMSAFDLDWSGTAWQMTGVSVDEAAGASGSFLFKDTTTFAFDGTYSSPSSSAATYAAEILGAGNAQFPAVSGTRIAMFAIWEGTALSTTDISDIYNDTKGRFGL